MENDFCNLGIFHVVHPVSQSRPPQKHFGLKCLELREAVSSTRHFCQTTFVVCTYCCLAWGDPGRTGLLLVLKHPKMFQTLRVLGFREPNFKPGLGASRRRTSLQGHFEARREQLLCSAQLGVTEKTRSHIMRQTIISGFLQEDTQESADHMR